MSLIRFGPTQPDWPKHYHACDDEGAALCGIGYILIRFRRNSQEDVRAEWPSASLCRNCEKKLSEEAA